MCRTGGPYCYERKLSRPARTKLNAKRVARLTKKIGGSSDARFDGDRSARARAQAYLSGGETKQSGFSHALREISAPDGGATINAVGEVPTSGFCYSPFPERSVAYRPPQKIELRDLNKYVRDNDDLLSQEGHFVGLWNDPQDGTVYLDVSVVTMEASEARQQCEEKDQIAFFDLQDFSSVTVNPDATSGQG